MATSKPTTLADRVQALPPELFEAVYELTIAYPHETRVDTTAYKPPLQLQIDHRLREKFAAEYYRKITFVLRGVSPTVSSALAWLEHLPEHHRNLIRHVRLEQDLSQAFAKRERLTIPRPRNHRVGKHMVDGVFKNGGINAELDTIAYNGVVWDPTDDTFSERWMVYERKTSGYFELLR